MPMPQQEIDELSHEFSQAWEDYFASPFYILKYKDPETVDNLYDEVIGKRYEEMGPVNAIFKQDPDVEELRSAGLHEAVNGILVFVTKDLRDQGIFEIKAVDRIKEIDRDGNIKYYTVSTVNRRVQFGDNRLFTRVGVYEVTSKGQTPP